MLIGKRSFRIFWLPEKCLSLPLVCLGLYLKPPSPDVVQMAKLHMEMFLASGKWKPSSPLRPTSLTWKLGSRLFQGKTWSWHQFRFSPVPKIVDRFTLNLEWDASNVWNAGLNRRSWAKADKIRNSMWSTIEPHYATGSWAFKAWKY